MLVCVKEKEIFLLGKFKKKFEKKERKKKKKPGHCSSHIHSMNPTVNGILKTHLFSREFKMVTN